jgi:hypothetical protein
LTLSWNWLKENPSINVLPALLLFEEIIASFSKIKMQ